MSTIYIPRKRIYAPTDRFFEEGNIALRAIWLKRQAESVLEVDMIQHEEKELLEHHEVLIYCDHCRMKFPSVVAFESHYEAVHRNVCIECHKIFPAFEWLQLHIDEFHNILLQIKKERGEKIYKCYVHSCEKVFLEPRKRRLHLIDKHKYPNYFPFDLVYTGTLSFEQRKIKDQKNKDRLRRLGMVEQKKNHDLVMYGNHKLKEEDHDTKDVNMDGGSESKDVDMDELITNMSNLKIPKSISFGHRLKPAIPQHRHHKSQPEKKDLIKEVKVYAHPRKRGPKKKKLVPELMVE